MVQQVQSRREGGRSRAGAVIMRPTRSSLGAIMGARSPSGRKLARSQECLLVAQLSCSAYVCNQVHTARSWHQPRTGAQGRGRSVAEQTTIVSEGRRAGLQHFAVEGPVSRPKRAFRFSGARPSTQNARGRVLRRKRPDRGSSPTAYTELCLHLFDLELTILFLLLTMSIRPA
jgi:hypothetical protein